MPTLAHEDLTRRLQEIQGGVCFICQESLQSLVEEKLDIDHIVPRAKGGKDDENNFALTHARCNRSKLDADLRVARCMARYEKIKSRVLSAGPNRPNLGDFLADVSGGRDELIICVDDLRAEFSFPGLGLPPQSVPLYTDPLSKMRYFFAELPIEVLHHDDRINPRAVGDRLRALIGEFLGGYPQLHPSLGWVAPKSGDAKVRIFDGQHKAVAQILLGVRRLPVRIFVDPDTNVLLETNTRAGTLLRQIAFDKSVQRSLGSQIFWEKVEAYRKANNLPEDDSSFSEQDLVRFFRGEQRELKRYIVDDIRASVIHHPDNRLKAYVEFGGKGTTRPLSYNAIEKTFFSQFIHKDPMAFPLGHLLDVGQNPRQFEKDQLLRLMNLFADEIFVGRFDSALGTYRIEEKLRQGEDIPDPHLRAVRLAREEILHNVLRYVRECVRRYFLMQEGGRLVEDKDLFQQRFPDRLWEHLQHVVQNLANLPLWVNKESTISSAVFGGKQAYDFWKQVFDTGTTPGGSLVLAKGLTLDDLLR